MAVSHTGAPMDQGTIKLITTLIERMMTQEHPSTIAAVADHQGNIVQLDS